MRKFIQPVAMPVNLEQYLAMKPELEKLGYIPYQMDTQFIDEYYFLLNSWAQHNERTQHYFFVKAPLEPIRSYNGAVFIEYNPELFLALAACSDSPFGGIGEYWVFKGGSHEPFTDGGLYKQINEDIRKPFAFLDDIGSKNGYSGGGEYPPVLDKFRKATAEEIIAHFTKDSQKRESGLKVGDSVAFKIEDCVERIGKIIDTVPDGKSFKVHVPGMGSPWIKASILERIDPSFFDQISGETDAPDEPKFNLKEIGDAIGSVLKERSDELKRGQPCPFPPGGEMVDCAGKVLHKFEGSTWVPQPGEVVECRMGDSKRWSQRVFICFIEGMPFLKDEDDNSQKKSFRIHQWDEIRQYKPVVEVSLDELLKVYSQHTGIDLQLLKVKK